MACNSLCLSLTLKELGRIDCTFPRLVIFLDGQCFLYTRLLLKYLAAYDELSRLITRDKNVSQNLATSSLDREIHKAAHLCMEQFFGLSMLSVIYMAVAVIFQSEIL